MSNHLSDMSVDQLQAILSNVTEEKEKNVDWISRKEWWLRQLENLYSDIEDWCSEISTIKIEKFETTIEEKFIGIYRTFKLVLSIGSDRFTINPVARNVIGSRGRVDIWHNSTRNIIVLFEEGEIAHKNNVNKNKPYNPEPESTEWFFLDHSKKPKLKLDKKSFLNFLVESVSA